MDKPCIKWYAPSIHHKRNITYRKSQGLAAALILVDLLTEAVGLIVLGLLPLLPALTEVDLLVVDDVLLLVLVMVVVLTVFLLYCIPLVVHYYLI